MTRAPHRLETALADRYSIERELGSGGMATVYLADDRRHHRRVAIKVLREELAAALGASRFLREIEITARLNHPHILPLLDSGDADGLLYYVMPYVEGESLRDRIVREKRLAMDDVVRVVREVADALQAAHRHGVIHRDIKPENILFSEGHAVVADFGVARGLRAKDAEHLTSPGFAVGTPGYCSPEQIGGEELDERTDVYGTACVIYEMLAGEPPFAASTTRAVIARQFIADLRPIAAVRPDVPAGVDMVLRQAMAPEATDRQRSMEDLAAALERAAAGEHRIGGGMSSTQPGLPVIAVVPFMVVSDADQDRSWAAGFAEDVRAKLARVGGLRAIGVPAHLAPRDATGGLGAIAAHVSADFLLYGEVRQLPDGVSVTVRLLGADGRSLLWADTFAGRSTQVFAMQADVARGVAEAVSLALDTEQHAALAKPAAVDIEAYEHYLQGRFFWSERTAGHNQRAMEAFKQALAVDPRYARAYAGLADAHLVAATYGWGSPDMEYVLAQQFARRALELEPTLAEAHATLGAIATDHLWAPGTAEAELRLAIEADPSYATAHSWLGLLLGSLARGEEAWSSARRAHALDPLSPIVAANLVAVGTVSGHAAEAVRVGEQARIRSAQHLPLLFYLALAQEALEDLDAAEGVARELVKLVPGHPAARLALARVYCRRGDAAHASALLAELESLPAHPDAPYVFASIAALLGRADAAFAYLDEAFAVRSYYLLWLGVDPNWEALRGDPRFGQALARRGLVLDPSA